jgi:hypothetical protein
VFLENRISLGWNNPFEDGILDFIVETFKHQCILETQFYKSLPTNSVSTSFSIDQEKPELFLSENKDVTAFGTFKKVIEVNVYCTLE